MKQPGGRDQLNESTWVTRHNNWTVGSEQWAVTARGYVLNPSFNSKQRRALMKVKNYQELIVWQKSMDLEKRSTSLQGIFRVKRYTA